MLNQQTVTTTQVNKSEENNKEISTNSQNTTASNSKVNNVKSDKQNNAFVSGTLKVHFIDVGQGDSEFIQTPSGKTMFIDAGTNEAGNSVVSYLKSLGINRIDILIGTHPHEIIYAVWIM
nr:hypothetical protein [Thermoanaerobacterium thermosaccharolyticum]